MKTIKIDFDVFKGLTLRRSTENVTYNDVLRKLLGLNPRKRRAPLDKQISGAGDWVTKGVRFPNGTKFRASYKGQTYYGKVESGRLVVDNKRFHSPTAAAVSITGHQVNGWTFWECCMPGKSFWKTIKSLRKQEEPTTVKLPVAEEQQRDVRHYKGARGCYINGKRFKILKGSLASGHTSATFDRLGYVADLRGQLIASGTLTRAEGQGPYTFMEDYVFPSASAAASIVNGNSRSGYQAWGRP
jgi:hypothetical protein